MPSSIMVPRAGWLEEETEGVVLEGIGVVEVRRAVRGRRCDGCEASRRNLSQMFLAGADDGEEGGKGET